MTETKLHCFDHNLIFVVHTKKHYHVQVCMSSLLKIQFHGILTMVDKRNVIIFQV